MPARTGVTAAKTGSSSLRGMRAASSTRAVGLALLSVVVGLVGSPALASLADAAPRAGLQPGDVVVTDQEAGEVLAIAADGSDTVLLDDLGAVRGVVVLSDGAVLAADSDAGTIVGTGGRFGDERVEVATGLESPEALAVAGGGRLYVTSFSEGTLSRVDISSGQVAGLAAGLDGPSAVLALRTPRSVNHVAVAEWFGAKVTELRRDGERTGTLVRGFDRPAGLATDGDGTVYVSDRDSGQIVAVDAEGDRRVVTEVDAPAGLSLDPAEPAPGQDYDLVAATADGVQRIDVASGDATVVNDLATTVAVAVAPDEFIVAGVPSPSATEGGTEGAAGGGDQVASGVNGRDLDPVMVALVAIAVFLFGVALVSGIQLWRNRGDEDEGDRYAGLSRKERRRARRTDRAVQAAERKTAKEVDKAEKRAAKLAPDPEPGTADDGPSRKERKAAERAAKEQARQDAVNAKRRATLEAQRARRDEVLAKADAKQAKADAKAQAKADARAAKTKDKNKDKAEATGEGDAGPTPERSVPADDRPAPSSLSPTWPGTPAGAPGLEADLPTTTGPVGGLAGADEREAGGRAPLFATPPAAPSTAGPFLESLFTGDGPPAEAPAPAAAAPEPEPAPTPEPAPEAAPALQPEPAPVEAAVPEPAPVAPLVPLVTSPATLEPAGVDEDGPRPDLSEQVAREVPPPRGVRGRRKAKRRSRAAEHRHRQLRAITAILDVPPPALPPAPVRRAIGVASAASVASPDAPPSPPAALGAGTPGLDAPVEPTPTAGVGDGPAVPWPGEGDVRDPSAAWPNQPTSH